MTDTWVSWLQLWLLWSVFVLVNFPLIGPVGADRGEPFYNATGQKDYSEQEEGKIAPHRYCDDTPPRGMMETFCMVYCSGQLIFSYFFTLECTLVRENILCPKRP